jgi:hypothetical protein
LKAPRLYVSCRNTIVEHFGADFYRHLAARIQRRRARLPRS